MQNEKIPAGATAMKLDAEVFLAGNCGTTTWRRDIAIPALESAGISYCNPQINDYEDTDDYFRSMGFQNGCADVERMAKDRARALLFVVDGQMRGVASLVELTEFLLTRPTGLFFVIEYITPGTLVWGGDTVGVNEAKDLNRGRNYALELAKKYGLTPYGSIKEAVEAVVRYCS